MAGLESSPAKGISIQFTQCTHIRVCVCDNSRHHFIFPCCSILISFLRLKIQILNEQKAILRMVQHGIRHLIHHIDIDLFLYAVLLFFFLLFLFWMESLLYWYSEKMMIIITRNKELLLQFITKFSILFLFFLLFFIHVFVPILFYFRFPFSRIIKALFSPLFIFYLHFASLEHKQS